jgi:hypothetical protein
MAAPQAEAVVMRKKAIGSSSRDEPVDHSASLRSQDSDSITPRIHIHRYSDSVSSVPITIADQEEGFDWGRDTTGSPQLSNYVSTSEHHGLSLHANSTTKDQHKELYGDAEISATLHLEQVRRDSVVRSVSNDCVRNGLAYPHNSLDTTSGADSPGNERLAPFRRRPSFLHIKNEPEVQLYVVDATQGGAEPPEDSDNEISLSAVSHLNK